ncbi:MAG: hypothetical protein IJ200_07505 [Prevotella sp.]|nr:hypothetical protein [Prevotella sp.]
MKKFLLLMSAALFVSVTVSAQLQQRATKVPVNQRTIEKQIAPKVAKEQGAVAMKAPRRSFYDAMYYARPYGTFYNTFTNSGSSYNYLVFPNFTNLTYLNMTNGSNRAETQWFFEGSNGSENVAEGNENNDLEEWYAIPSGRLYYLPILKWGNATFTIGEDYNFAQVGCISTDDIMDMTKWDTVQGHTYTGYDVDSYGFGTGVRTFDFDGDGEEESVFSDGIVEYFDKPASPLYLTKIILPVLSSNQDNLADAFAGKELHAQIIKAGFDENYRPVLTDEVLADMTITSDDITDSYNFTDGGSYGYVDIVNKTLDDFGFESEEPLVINDMFALVITGWGQEGVDLGLFFGNAAAASYDYVMGIPTYEMYYDEATGDYKGQLFSYGTTPTGATVCYNAYILLEGMFDVAYISEEFEEFVAPVEGGIIETKAEFLEDEDDPASAYHQNAIEVYSTMPWFSTEEGQEEEANYYLVPANEEDEVPDWLSLTGFTDQYYESYMINILQLTAEPLPSDITGRYCQLKIVSDRGAESAVITIVQGDAVVPDAAVNAVKFDGKGQGEALYNLNGQRVGKDFKGLVIKNGKKYVVK